jgi:hypothetical protein
MYTQETIDEQVIFLEDAGYSGALNDMLLAYYNVQNSGTETTLPDALYKFLISLGLSGTIPDMLFVNGSYFDKSGVTYWILKDGTWDDTGVWIDTETWDDGA